MDFGSVADGKLSFTVWPAWIGLCNADLGTPPFTVAEPTDDPSYKRGQIQWRHEDGEIVGSARVHAPAGIYTHFAFYQHPTERQLTGITKMPHALHLTEFHTLDIDPIKNTDLELNVPEAPP